MFKDEWRYYRQFIIFQVAEEKYLKFKFKIVFTMHFLARCHNLHHYQRIILIK